MVAGGDRPSPTEAAAETCRLSATGGVQTKFRLRYVRPWSSAPHLASFLSQKAGQRTLLVSPRLGRAAAALKTPVSKR